VKELADVGTLVIIAPLSQERVQLCNQLRGLQRYVPPRPGAHRVHETSKLILPRVRIKRPRFHAATNLLGRAMSLQIGDVKQMGVHPAREPDAMAFADP
jgi:hypothetical protein